MWSMVLPMCTYWWQEITTTVLFHGDWLVFLTLEHFPMSIVQFVTIWWEGLCCSVVILLATIACTQIYHFLLSEVRKFRSVLRLATLNATLRRLELRLAELEGRAAMEASATAAAANATNAEGPPDPPEGVPPADTVVEEANGTAAGAAEPEPSVVAGGAPVSTGTIDDGAGAVGAAARSEPVIETPICTAADHAVGPVHAVIDAQAQAQAQAAAGQQIAEHQGAPSVSAPFVSASSSAAAAAASASASSEEGEEKSESEMQSALAAGDVAEAVVGGGGERE